MKFFNLTDVQEVVSFVDAVTRGIGRNRGLFFPSSIPKIQNIDKVLGLPFVQRSQHILGLWLAGELGQTVVDEMVQAAFDFPVVCHEIDQKLCALELFHGPTLAFKDFGARFMAQCLRRFSQGDKITILTATSGDTGAAVASAFAGMPNVRVVILYPQGKISPLQEKMFSTIGNNIECLAVDGDFDSCQALVKQAFVDDELNARIKLNSANSINVSRLLAQICYYFEAIAKADSGNMVVSVPSGNFGNLTAGLLAHEMGLPVKRFIAATNSNDTVVRYLGSGQWLPEKTVATMSNAMDVSDPSNWPRVAKVITDFSNRADLLRSYSIDEKQTVESMRELYSAGYTSEPHAAVAAAALKRDLGENEKGIFLATAHPAKFVESVEKCLNINVNLPEELVSVIDKPILSKKIRPDFSEVKKHLMNA